MSADDSQLEDIVGVDLVYTKATTNDVDVVASEAGNISPTLRTHESRVLSLVDGRRTVADILLLSPLGHPATLQHLRSLYERGVLLRQPGPDQPAPRPRASTGGNVIVIDTRHRDRTSMMREPPSMRPVTLAGARTVMGSEPAPTGVTSVTKSAAPPSAGVASVTTSAAPTSTTGAAPSPFKLGRYEVATRIGQGGMGSIYVCRLAGAVGIDRLFTLKVVRQYSDQQEVAAESLLREGRIAGKLTHPNVQSVVETGTYKNQPYLILDYIAGVSLTDILSSERRPPPAVVVSILIDVLRGLDAAHNLKDARGLPLGLVHGDVSPPNVLVGVDGVARITDFGSSWLASEAHGTRANAAALGKPSYMAPEQLCAEPLDARTDIFAMGAVMHLALTGQELFLAETYEGVVMNVLRKRIAPPSELGAPPALDEVCMRALSRSKDGRFSTAAAMAHALFQAAAAQELVASPREVADYMRREFGEVVDEQKRRIQRAFEAGAPTQGSGTFELPTNAALTPTPARGLPSTESAGENQVEPARPRREPAMTGRPTGSPPASPSPRSERSRGRCSCPRAGRGTCRPADGPRARNRRSVSG